LEILSWFDVPIDFLNWQLGLGKSTLHFGSMAVVQVEDLRTAFSFVIEPSPLSIGHFYDQHVQIVTPPAVHDSAENDQKQDYLMHFVFSRYKCIK
jgi:hypothetical protein